MMRRLWPIIWLLMSAAVAVAQPINPPIGGSLSRSAIFTDIPAPYVTQALHNLTGLSRAGDAMLGALTLAGPPVNPLDAVTKAYVDSFIGGGSVLSILGNSPIVVSNPSGIVTLSLDPLKYLPPEGGPPIINVATDGSTDSWPGMLARIQTGGDILLPAGTIQECAVTQAQITVSTAIRANSNLTLITAPQAPCTHPTLDLICVPDGNGNYPFLTIQGLVINGQKIYQDQQQETSGAGPHGIHITNCPHLRVYDNYLLNVAGHGFFISNPGVAPVPLSPVFADQHIENNFCTNNGVHPRALYGSCYAITNGYNVSLIANKALGVAKAVFRYSGFGNTFTNNYGEAFGDGGHVPLSAFPYVTDSTLIYGDHMGKGTQFSSSNITGNTSNGSAAITGLSSNVMLASNAITTTPNFTPGWQVGDNISDTGGCIPAGTGIANITPGSGTTIQLGLLSDMQLAPPVFTPVHATCSVSNDTFIVTNQTYQGEIDGFRVGGSSNITLNGVYGFMNPGCGASAFNRSLTINMVGSHFFNNGLNPVPPVAGLEGRSEICIGNNGGDTNPSLGGNILGNQVYDNQSPPTGYAGIEIAQRSGGQNITSNEASGSFTNVAGSAFVHSSTGPTSTVNFDPFSNQGFGIEGAANLPSLFITGGANLNQIELRSNYAPGFHDDDTAVYLNTFGSGAQQQWGTHWLSGGVVNCVNTCVYGNAAAIIFGKPTATGNASITNADSFIALGQMVGQAGMSVAGATISLNNNSSFPVNLCTGTCNSTVTLGNAAAGAVAVPSKLNVSGNAALTSSLGLTRRSITSGTVDSAITTDIVVIWHSASGGTKTETLPTCNSQHDGAWVRLIDAQGDAGTNVISAIALSGGSIRGSGASLPVISTNYGWAEFECDGSISDWAVRTN